MELNQDGFLEELLSLGKETFDHANSVEMNDLFTTSWGFDSFDGMISNPLLPPPILQTPFECFSSPIRPNLDCSFNDLYAPIFDVKFTAPPDLVDDFRPYHNPKKLETPFVPSHEEFSVPIVDEEELGLMQEDNIVQLQGACKVELGQCQSIEVPGFSVEFCVEKTKKKKKRKIEGQPSKNLMAERRRRKRLNDRLSMLRSVVPKISKMDRTSILGDTIDYMKELQERINNLQEEIDVNSSELNGVSLFKNRNTNDALVRTSPKFDVERRNTDTRIEICCTGKPGLLLSTMTTFEAMGLEIQQCVISCFNDFSLQASCSEELEQRTLVTSEEMKQALFRNAGYGGKCM